VPGATLQEIRGNLVELAAWRQRAEDPSGFVAALKVCPLAADDLAAALHEQLQLDPHPTSLMKICAKDRHWMATAAPTAPAPWSFHALYESSIFLCPNDSRLHEALHKPTRGGKTALESQWVSSSLHVDLAASVDTVEISIPQWTPTPKTEFSQAGPARVWIAADADDQWRLIAISGPVKSWGHVSSNDAGQVNS